MSAAIADAQDVAAVLAQAQLAEARRAAAGHAELPGGSQTANASAGSTHSIAQPQPPLPPLESVPLPLTPPTTPAHPRLTQLSAAPETPVGTQGSEMEGSLVTPPAAAAVASSTAADDAATQQRLHAERKVSFGSAHLFTNALQS